jgi:hypothetical protein
MTMIKHRKLVAASIIIIVLLFTLTPTIMKVSFCSYNPRKIDVFTNKVPFDGKGANESSDAFQPQELVILYALVTYNDDPLKGKLVAFQVNNPLNAFRNITIIGVNLTDNNGIASFCFRIPWPQENPEQIIFGEWSVVATANIDEEVVVDTLTFQVGWIVQITNIKTLNAELKPQISFKRGEKIIFELTTRNIALSTKNAVIIVDVQDAANYPIMHIEEFYNFNPGEQRIQVVSEIPATATIGKATVSANMFSDYPKNGGTPYCPPVLSQFDIIAAAKYYLKVRIDPPGITTIAGEGWYNEGATVPLTAPDTVSVLTGARYKFCYWDIDGIQADGNPITVLMDANHTATAHYRLEYYLTVKTSPPSITIIPGEGWYNAYVNVSLFAPPIMGYDFEYWDVDGESKPIGMYQIIVYMDGPHVATAHYSVRKPQYEWLYLILLVILILLIILLIILTYRRIKKRKTEEAFYRGWTAWYYCYNLKGNKI